jgi:hypothetical protein
VRHLGDLLEASREQTDGSHRPRPERESSHRE